MEQIWHNISSFQQKYISEQYINEWTDELYDDVYVICPPLYVCTYSMALGNGTTEQLQYCRVPRIAVTKLHMDKSRKNI